MLWENEIENELCTPVLGSIPCFCNVNFNKREFLSAISDSGNPFSKRVIAIANKIKGIEKNIVGDIE